MPKRELDPDFDGETLYRGVEPKANWFRHGRLTSMSVTLQKCSFDRSKYRADPAQLLERRERYCDVVYITVAEVESIRELEDASPGAEVETHLVWRMQDSPKGCKDEGGPNTAHCDAVAIRDGGDPAQPAKFSSNAERRIKKALAHRLQRLHLRTCPWDDDASTS